MSGRSHSPSVFSQSSVSCDVDDLPEDCATFSSSDTDDQHRAINFIKDIFPVGSLGEEERKPGQLVGKNNKITAEGPPKIVTPYKGRMENQEFGRTEEGIRPADAGIIPANLLVKYGIRNKKQTTANKEEIKAEQRERSKLKNHYKPSPVVNIDAIDECAVGVSTEFHVDFETQLVCTDWKLLKERENVVRLMVRSSSTSYIDCFWDVQETTCLESDNTLIVGLKLVVECHEFDNGSCVASFIPMRYGSSSCTKNIYYMIPTAFIINGIQAHGSVTLSTCSPLPPNSELRPNFMPVCTQERMNIVYLSIHSSINVGPREDVHKNWRGFYTNKKRKGCLQGFDTKNSRTTETTPTDISTNITYKGLFTHLFETTTKYIKSNIDTIPRKGFFDGINNKTVEHQLQESFGSLPVKLSGHDIICFARACPFFVHGETARNKERAVLQKLADVLPTKYDPSSNVAEKNEILALLHSLGMDKKIILDMSSVIPKLTDDVSDHLKSISGSYEQTQLRYIILALAYAHSITDVYLDFNGCVRLELFKHPVTKFASFELGDSLSLIAELCRSHSNECMSTYSNLEFKIARLIEMMKNDFGHVIQNPTMVETSYVVTKMSVVYQFDEVQDSIPQSVYTRGSSTEKSTTNTVTVYARTAMKNATKPIVVYKKDNHKIVSSFRQVSRVLENIRRSLYTCRIPINKDFLPIPKKQHAKSVIWWEGEFQHDPSCFNCLLTHKNSEVHSVSESLMMAGSSIFFSDNAFSEATKTEQCTLHTTLSGTNTRHGKTKGSTSLTSDKLLALLCGSDWKSMKEELRFAVLSWFLFFFLLNSYHHPKFIMRYENYPLILKLINLLQHSVQLSSIVSGMPLLEQNGTLTSNGRIVCEIVHSVAGSHYKQEDLFTALRVPHHNTVNGASHLFFWDHGNPSMMIASRKRGVSRGEMNGTQLFKRTPNEDDEEFETYECTFKFKVPRENKLDNPQNL
jgi:hypothetical protein